MDVTLYFNSLSFQEKLVFFILLFQLLCLVFLAFNGIMLKKLLNRYRNLLSGNGPHNLEDLLLDLGERLKRVEAELKTVEERIGKMEDEAINYLQRWALHRYQAFANTGGDQSFSFVLLDKKGDGILVSSIYGRDESRTYAKSIKGGKANYPLSDEEHEVLASAIQKK
ncbi:MAG: DUF4446 family protein [Firmicutes bacterium]|nr:DUF4446 family protein [Bacillota bacterium]